MFRLFIVGFGWLVIYFRQLMYAWRQPIENGEKKNRFPQNLALSQSNRKTLGTRLNRGFDFLALPINCYWLSPLPISHSRQQHCMTTHWYPLKKGKNLSTNDFPRYKFYQARETVSCFIIITVYNWIVLYLVNLLHEKHAWDGEPTTKAYFGIMFESLS